MAHDRCMECGDYFAFEKDDYLCSWCGSRKGAGMTTTPDPTPEQIARRALVKTQRDGLPRPRQAAHVVAALRAHGLLVGDSTEEQIEPKQCGPCRRGQHGCCDGNEYVRCDDSNGTPSPDRKKLIAELKVWASDPAPEAGDVVPGRVLQSVAKRALAALTAAAPVLDEERSSSD